MSRAGSKIRSLTAELFCDGVARVTDNPEQDRRNDSRDREVDALLRVWGRHPRSKNGPASPSPGVSVHKKKNNRDGCQAAPNVRRTEFVTRVDQAEWKSEPSKQHKQEPDVTVPLQHFGRGLMTGTSNRNDILAAELIDISPGYAMSMDIVTCLVSMARDKSETKII